MNLVNVLIIGFLKQLLTLSSISLIYLIIAFCCMNHKMPIEKGRFHNIERSLRVCILCNTNQLGDKFNYLFNCTYFNTLRNTYIDRIFFIISKYC